MNQLASLPPTPTAHIEPIIGLLRVYAPGDSYAGRDPFAASALVQWVDAETIEIRGMARNEQDHRPSVSMASARGAIVRAAIDAGAKFLQCERYRNGKRKPIRVDLATNRIIR